MAISAMTDSGIPVPGLPNGTIHSWLMLDVVNIIMHFFGQLQFDQLFNFFEAILWLAISIVFLIYAIRKAKYRILKIFAALAFALFGLSDLIEMRTGVWYSPWPLLVLKLSCVLLFIILIRIYAKNEKRIRP